MIYLGTSCLLKLLLEEPDSEAVRMTVARESEVIVSELAELETAVQLRAGWLAGEYRELHCRTLDRLHLAAMEELDVRRLMTTDAAEADGARALGFEVVHPGRH
jgi:uncharacterized protein with PIN domain